MFGYGWVVMMMGDNTMIYRWPNWWFCPPHVQNSNMNHCRRAVTCMTPKDKQVFNVLIDSSLYTLHTIVWLFFFKTDFFFEKLAELQS